MRLRMTIGPEELKRISPFRLGIDRVREVGGGEVVVSKLSAVQAEELASAYLSATGRLAWIVD